VNDGGAMECDARCLFLHHSNHQLMDQTKRTEKV